MSHHPHHYGWAQENQRRQYSGASSANSEQPGPRLPPLQGLLAGVPSGHEHTEPHQPHQPYSRPHIPPIGSHPPPYQQQSHGPYPPSAPSYHEPPQPQPQPPPPPPARHYQEPHPQHRPPLSDPKARPGHLPDPELSMIAQGRDWNQQPQPPPATYPISHPYSQAPGHGSGQTHLAHESHSRPWDPAEVAAMNQQMTGPQVSARVATLSEIPNLLASNRAHTIQGLKFLVSMRQQPKAARACGSGERDRRNIDPPPIIQLNVEAPEMTKEELAKYLRYESYVMTCSITDETGTQDASQMPAEYRHQRRLTGSLVGTPFVGKDENKQEGCFFPFSDLSVRTLGRYRLKFSMIMIDPTKAGQCRHFPILAEILSAPFDVYTAKEFPGINESTKLVRTLREQGCIIAIKKGNDKKRRAREDDESEEDDEGNDDKRINTRG